jgi:tetratricopeptide (TPR) repeat protein
VSEAAPKLHMVNGNDEVEDEHYRDDDNDKLTIAMFLKGICLLEMKRFDEALVLFDQVIERIKDILNKLKVGENHFVMAERLNDKSLCLQQMNHSEEALPLCEQALAINMKAYGPSHPDVALCLLTKALCLDSLQRYGEALDLLNQCLTIRGKVHRG